MHAIINHEHRRRVMVVIMCVYLSVRSCNSLGEGKHTSSENISIRDAKDSEDF